jgi:chemotaxis protein CheX
MSEALPKPTVLVVDESADLRTQVLGLIKALTPEAKILEVSSIKDMMAKTANQKFDLLVADTRVANVAGSGVVSYIGKIPDANAPGAIYIVSDTVDEFELMSELPTATLFRLPLDASVLEKNYRDTFKIPLPPSKAAAPRKGGFDTEFVNPFLEGTLKALMVFSKIEFTRENLYIRAPGQPSGDISGIMPIDSGVYTGSFSVSFDEATFCKVASGVTGTQVTSISAAVQDVASEVCNQVYGLAKKALNDLGHTLKPTFPTVIVGKGHSVGHSVQGACVAVRFSSPVGGIQVEIVLRPVT